MAKIHARWKLHGKGELIIEGTVLYQVLNLTVGQFNAFSNCKLLGAAAAQNDHKIMLIHVSQRICVAKIFLFSDMREESRLK